MADRTGTHATIPVDGVRLDGDLVVPAGDQLALALTWLGAPAWFRATFTPSVLAAAVVVTPVFHVGTNALASLAGLNDVPR